MGDEPIVILKIKAKHVKKKEAIKIASKMMILQILKQPLPINIDVIHENGEVSSIKANQGWIDRESQLTNGKTTTTPIGNDDDESIVDDEQITPQYPPQDNKDSISNRRKQNRNRRNPINPHSEFEYGPPPPPGFDPYYSMPPPSAPYNPYYGLYHRYPPPNYPYYPPPNYSPYHPQYTN